MGFYVLDSPSPGPWVTEVYYKRVYCSACGERPVARVGGLKVCFKAKNQLTDFSLTPEGYVVRSSVVASLTEARLSGWRAGNLKVEAVPRLNNEDLDYAELVIIGRTQTYADYVALDVEKESCSVCGFRPFYFPPEHGLPIPLETWDGSDIFGIHELPGECVVTSDFRDHILERGYTGLILTPVEEWADGLASVTRHRRA